MTEPNEQRFFDARARWRTVLGWALIGLGTIFLVLGWYGVSGEPDVARQLSYIASGGVGGLAAAVVGVGLLVSEDVRAERRRLGRIEAAMLEVQDLLRAQVTEDDEQKATDGRTSDRS